MKEMSDEVKAGIGISIVTCFMFFLYSPLETYFTNIDEVWYDFYLLFPPMFIVFAFFCCMSIGILMLIKKKSNKIYYYCILLYVIVFICSYIQGNFLAQSLPILDGTWIEWSDYPVERIKCIVVWVIVSGIMIWLGKKLLNKTEQLYRGIAVVSVCMVLMFGVTLMTLAIANDGLRQKERVSATTENLFKMSEDTNYIIFCLDGISSYDFSNLLERHEEWNDVFSDFTYYENTFGVYCGTMWAVPFFFSGEIYDAEKPYMEYLTDSYLESEWIRELEHEGYHLGLYIEDTMLPDAEGMTKYNNIIDSTFGINDYLTFTRWNIQIVGFKYAPFDLKRFCFVDPNAFAGLKKLQDGYESFSGDNQEMYQLIKESNIEIIDDKVFKYIHIDGGHGPFYFNEQVERVDNATYESCIEASVTITEAYLDKLKESGIYDNSVIIVLADHGWDENHKAEVIEPDCEVLRWYTPILLIKGIEEKHDFEISKAPISYVDLPDAFETLKKGSMGNKLFLYEEGDKRERKCRYIRSGEMIEFVQKGYAHDPDTAYFETIKEVNE